MSKKVLIVEDDPKNMKLVLMTLKPRGYELICAVDGEEALHTTFTEKPDIILMDMQLPKLSGIDATKQIKEHPDFADIPILALTAYAMKGDEDKYIEAGCVAYMSKPINTRELPVKVAELLGE
ncbi:MAG: response regulator [Dehalococcoidales bacterium]|nr:MAG: response regulator [Dehalococcoidales bacterium]